MNTKKLSLLPKRSQSGLLSSPCGKDRRGAYFAPCIRIIEVDNTDIIALSLLIKDTERIYTDQSDDIEWGASSYRSNLWGD